MAAKITGIGGITLAIAGVASAHAAEAHATPTVVDERKEGTPPTTPTLADPAADDSPGPLPFEQHAKAGGGNCGCSPCWGPPAPPIARRSSRSTA